MTENKTEIRARRGVRLAMLRKIGEGNLSERLLRYQCLHLADFKKHLGLEEIRDMEYGEEFDLDDYFLLGGIFEGGGLLPHEDEVPGLRELRNERSQELWG